MGNSFTGSLVSEILPLVSGEQALFLTADSKRPLGSLLEVGFPGGSCCKKGFLQLLSESHPGGKTVQSTVELSA